MRDHGDDIWDAIPAEKVGKLDGQADVGKGVCFVEAKALLGVHHGAPLSRISILVGTRSLSAWREGLVHVVLCVRDNLISQTVNTSKFASHRTAVLLPIATPRSFSCKRAKTSLAAL